MVNTSEWPFSVTGLGGGVGHRRVDEVTFVGFALNVVPYPLAHRVQDHRAEHGHTEALCRQTCVDQEERQLLATALASSVHTVGGDSKETSGG